MSHGDTVPKGQRVEMVRRYLDEKQSIDTIATGIGWSYGTVRNVLRAEGVSLRASWQFNPDAKRRSKRNHKYVGPVLDSAGTPILPNSITVSQARRAIELYVAREILVLSIQARYPSVTAVARRVGVPHSTLKHVFGRWGFTVAVVTACRQKVCTVEGDFCFCEWKLKGGESMAKPRVEMHAEGNGELHQSDGDQVIVVKNTGGSDARGTRGRSAESRERGASGDRSGTTYQAGGKQVRRKG